MAQGLHERPPRRGAQAGAASVSRRIFCAAAAAGLAGTPRALAAARGGPAGRRASDTTLFLAGDVMLGRGIDQILPHPVDPVLKERFVTSAEDYVRLAERAHGPIPRNVDPDYVWGDALAVLAAAAPAARIVNLETSITDRGTFWPKAVNYRMAPRNAPVLAAGGIDIVSLANNHVLDFSREGLLDTLDTLREVGVKGAGAGVDSRAAAAPAIALGPAGRIVVFASGSQTSGIPPQWSATPGEAGVNLLPDLSDATLTQVVAEAAAARRPDDLLVASIHWGGNWGYEVPAEQVRFARGLVEGGFDCVHGHSSHHARAVEIWQDRPILYGCGDFVTDYEGISGHEDYRGDIALAFLPTFAQADRRLVRFRIVPFRVRRFRLERAGEADTAWIADVLDRESHRFGTRVRREGDGLEVVPQAA